MKPVTIHVAIPSMNEAEWLPLTLESLLSESVESGAYWICVNQPDTWWSDADKKHVCFNNQQTLEYLQALPASDLHILDYASKGKGWDRKKTGVGQARRVLMDAINQYAGPEDIILSMDADTLFDEGYLASVVRFFEDHPQAMALSNPYYHCLTGDELLDRAILRYEIYMRYYAINMWRIGSPYSFTALGSAIALKVKNYRKAGGITAKKSGEDFYFLQKLRKAGWVGNANTHMVYPGTRFSDRVFFGTGPALIKGSKGDWGSYPVYSHVLFDQVKATYDLFPLLYKNNVNTPMSAFLTEQFNEADPFTSLRCNATSVPLFIKACHQKIDGLRILQFLKSGNKALAGSDEGHLLVFLQCFYPECLMCNHQHPYLKEGLSESEAKQLLALDFSKTPLVLLDKLRRMLQRIESNYQKKDLS